MMLAMRWILEAARAKKGKPMAEKLAAELMDAAKNEGAAVKKKENTQKQREGKQGKNEKIGQQRDKRKYAKMMEHQRQGEGRRGKPILGPRRRARRDIRVGLAQPVEVHL